LKARANIVFMPIDDLPGALLIKRFLTLLVKGQKSNYPKYECYDHEYGEVTRAYRNKIGKIDLHRSQKHLILGEHPTSKLSTGRADVGQ